MTTKLSDGNMFSIDQGHYSVSQEIHVKYYLVCVFRGRDKWNGSAVNQ